MNTDTSSLETPAAPVAVVPRTVGIAALLRRLLRALRHLPDRLLHPYRGRALRARLRARGVPRSVLFVCFGNLCRSPYAALRLAELLPEELRETVRIRSAGFIGAGRASPSAAVAVAAERGLDLSPHRSSALTYEEVRTADLVVVMDTVQQRWIWEGHGRGSDTVVLLGDLDPDPILTRRVHDPIEQPAAVFHHVYTRIDRCVQELAAAFTSAARQSQQ